MTKTKTIIVFLTFFFGVLGLVKDSQAAAYYVLPSGTASWNQSKDINTPCSLSTANSNAAAGDTIYLRGGTYNISGSGINPSKTGALGNMITFSSYNNETVTLVGASTSATCVDLDSEYSNPIRSYIKVYGINCRDFYHQMWIRKGSHNEISHCTFIGMYDETNIDWIGSAIYRNASYNWVHNCTFGDYGYAGAGSDDGVVFEIGNDDVATGDNTNHNLVEDSVFYHGGHHVVSIDGYNNIFRNNYVHNEAWSHGYSNRVIFSVGETDNDVYRNLVEGNQIAYGGETPEPDQIGGSGGTLSSSYNIYRKNIFYQNGIYGLKFEYYGVLTAFIIISITMYFGTMGIQLRGR